MNELLYLYPQSDRQRERIYAIGRKVNVLEWIGVRISSVIYRVVTKNGRELTLQISRKGKVKNVNK